MVLVGTAYDETSEAVQYATKKHIYALPGTRFSDFERRIAQAEHLRFISWAGHFEPDSHSNVSHAYLFKYSGRHAIYYGRFIQEPDKRFEDAVKLSADDIAEPDLFTSKLKTRAEPLSSWLMDRFSDEGCATIIAWPGSGTGPKALEATLLKELNTIILGPPIYEEARFCGVTLRPGTSRLLTFDPDSHPGFQLTRDQTGAVLNRMLLQDAYPLNFPIKPERRMRDLVAIKF